jgi:hypothetical protein
MDSADANLLNWLRKNANVWVVDETDVTITVRVQPLLIMNPVEFTFPFRSEFNSFGNLAAEAIDRYLQTQTS